MLSNTILAAVTRRCGFLYFFALVVVVIIVIFLCVMFLNVCSFELVLLIFAQQVVPFLVAIYVSTFQADNSS